MNKGSPLFNALVSVIAEGNVVTLRNYLDNGNPNECDEYGLTLLMVACQHGQLSIVNELIAQGADVNLEDYDNWSALMNTAKGGYKEIAVKLLDHGAFIEKRDMGGWTPLMWACYKGHFATVKLLLEYGASVSVHDRFHCTCLIWAAGRGFLDIVKILLEYGAKTNSGDKYGSSPLVWACRKGYTEIVEVLLDAGANVDTAGMYSWTPLLVATKGNYSAIVNMLLECKPNVNAVDMDGCTALTVACKEGYPEIAVALMNSGAYINLQDRNGDTNLIHAAKAGHFSIVDALLKKYADVDLHGSDGKTALYWAVEKGVADTVRLLLRANPNMESSTKDGDTPLLKATRLRNIEIVQMLLENKCKISVTDKKGDTALHIAMRSRSKAIIEMLLRNPKYSQLLYRPNCAGETPYNIDSSHQKSILTQIFGARHLNTNEDSENRLGYDLYSSALADILSEPALSMPISVGLYAKWGSGKSFLLGKLENEMRSFAIQWMEPSFEFTWLVLLLILLTSVTGGLIMSLTLQSWIVGAAIACGVFFSSIIFLSAVIYGSRRYYWSKITRLSILIEAQLSSLRTLLYVLFCNPPNKRRDTVTDPVRFLFTEQTKVTSSGEDNSLVQIVISLYRALEKEFGFCTTRLFRVFKPKSVQAQKWQWRRLCCIPSCLIALFVFGCILTGLALLVVSVTVESSVKSAEESTIVHSVLIALACCVSLILVSNLYTWVQVVQALVISHHRRISSHLSHVDPSQGVNHVNSLKTEVDLIVQMVQCLDAFVERQTRLVIIVDGLDSCEQVKVLHILDAVRLLFSETSSPFLTVLAIDPHIIIKAIDSNLNRALQNSNVSGHEYLRNVVHLPFYLQNSGLRRVKAAQQAALLWTKKSTSYWNEDKECEKATTSTRKASNSSISVPDAFRKRSTKGNQKLKPSESMASSISNLHRMLTGAQDLSKVLLTDDYFSDVNPRSMRRLMNIVYITGRLLKAFTIDFNWYHLASWVNVTEQWPYRSSWIIMYYEMHENELDEMMSLKGIYEKIKGYMPTSKEEDPTLELDHDERKFEVFLSFHSSNLLINDLKVFLPFTINLDPFIRKTIQEVHQTATEILKTELRPSAHQGLTRAELVKWNHMHPALPKPMLTPSMQPNDFVNWGPFTTLQTTKNVFHYTSTAPPSQQRMISPPQAAALWNPQTGESFVSYQQTPTAPQRPTLPNYCMNIPTGQKLSLMTVEEVLSILSNLDKISKSKIQSYSNTLKENNINGQVLLTCDLKELKEVLGMSFGDWELFRVLILSLREQEMEQLSSSCAGVGGIMAEGSQSILQVSVNPQASNTYQRSSPSGCDSPDVKKKDNSTTSENRNKAEGDNRNYSRARSTGSSSMLERQVTMEDSMIVGALETLNEEALEDAIEEKLSIHRDSNAGTISTGAPSNPLSPILSDPEEQALDERLDLDQAEIPVTFTLNSPSDLEVMYLKNLRESPIVNVSALSLTSSIADIEAPTAPTHVSSVQPVLDIQSSPVPIIKTFSSGHSDSASNSASPSKDIPSEKAKTRNVPQRPSSLIYDTQGITSKKTVMESGSSGSPIQKPKSSHTIYAKKNSEKVKLKSKKKVQHQSSKKGSSSDSSSEKDAMLPSRKMVPLKIVSPQSEADGFYSDDEQTPLVTSNFVTSSSHTNQQSSVKQTKEGAMDKMKQVYTDQKCRKPLERQFSIDSYLCNRAKPNQVSSSSMVQIDTPSPAITPRSSEHHSLLDHGLPIYGQHVADTPSPEHRIAACLESNSGIHTETVL